MLTFADGVEIAVGSYPQRLVTGDLNGDGKLDLAVANTLSGSVSVLLSTTLPRASTPTFTDKTDFATTSAPIPISIGDLNGDGKLDLVVGNFYSQSISVFINTTSQGAMTPTFADKTDIATESVPISIAIGDLNDDGKPDLVIAQNSINTVSVLLNTTTTGATTPTFTEKTDFNIDSAYSVAIGDLNGDDKPDLAIANIDSRTVSVLFNTTTSNAATPTFTDTASYAVGNTPAWVAIGDLNGDNKPDLAIANGNSQTVSVLLNTTTPGATTPAFTDKTDFGTGNGSFAVAIGDLNGDGKPDLAVSNFASNTVSVLLNSTLPGASTPAFTDKTDLATGNGPQGVVIVDLNADGLQDMAIANLDPGSVSILLNAPTPVTVTLPEPGGSAIAMVVDGTLRVRRSRNSPDLIAPVALNGVGEIQFQGATRDDRLTLDRSLSAFQGSILFNGGNGNDSLNARVVGLDITFDGGNGNDTFLGGSGDDSVDGGAGNDSLSGSIGNDSLNGGAGSDRLAGDIGDDSVVGGAGADSISGGAGNDTLQGETGNDTLSGAEGADNLDGGDDNDSVVGGIGSDLLNGGAGNDRLQGDADDDVLFAGAGNDSLNGGAGNDTLLGEAGLDTLNGDIGNDVIDGGDDHDTLIGSDGNDSLRGGDGNDSINGGNGNDLLTGSAGDDRLYGMSGNDTLLGDDGNDTLVGSSGIDVINPGPDTDHDTISDGTAIIDTTFTFEFDELLAFEFDELLAFG